ncbi:hypothetical protein ACMFMG_009357 [Clarireedia jacksonii]
MTDNFIGPYSSAHNAVDGISTHGMAANVTNLGSEKQYWNGESFNHYNNSAGSFNASPYNIFEGYSMELPIPTDKLRSSFHSIRYSLDNHKNLDESERSRNNSSNYFQDESSPFADFSNSATFNMGSILPPSENNSPKASMAAVASSHSAQNIAFSTPVHGLSELLQTYTCVATASSGYQMPIIDHGTQMPTASQPTIDTFQNWSTKGLGYISHPPVLPSQQGQPDFSDDAIYHHNQYNVNHRSQPAIAQSSRSMKAGVTTRNIQPKQPAALHIASNGQWQVTTPTVYNMEDSSQIMSQNAVRVAQHHKIMVHKTNQGYQAIRQLLPKVPVGQSFMTSNQPHSNDTDNEISPSSRKPEVPRTLAPKPSMVDPTVTNDDENHEPISNFMLEISRLPPAAQAQNFHRLLQFTPFRQYMAPIIHAERARAIARARSGRESLGMALQDHLHQEHREIIASSPALDNVDEVAAVDRPAVHSAYKKRKFGGDSSRDTAIASANSATPSHRNAVRPESYLDGE